MLIFTVKMGMRSSTVARKLIRRFALFTQAMAVEDGDRVDDLGERFGDMNQHFQIRREQSLNGVDGFFDSLAQLESKQDHQRMPFLFAALMCARISLLSFSIIRLLNSVSSSSRLSLMASSKISTRSTEPEKKVS